jgi:ORF6N domain-containing protein
MRGMTAHGDLESKDIVARILSVRGQRVLLDSDLAAVYGVTTAPLNQQVNRNLDRFPPDFIFQLTDQEVVVLMLQFATSKPRTDGRKHSNGPSLR